MTTKVKIQKLSNFTSLLPSYATEHSAGMDLFAANIEPVAIKAGEIVLIPTGIAIALPFSFEAQIRPRSGLAAKHGITVANSPGTIDADYRGEIKVILINLSKQDFIIERGMRIAQIVIAKYEQISWEESDSLEETARGLNGFGSTGHL
nr:dUTP diphosphatase [Rickettsia endosymbiont of Ceutorhynchus assimilis]